MDIEQFAIIAYYLFYVKYFMRSKMCDQLLANYKTKQQSGFLRVKFFKKIRIKYKFFNVRLPGSSQRTAYTGNAQKCVALFYIYCVAICMDCSVIIFFCMLDDRPVFICTYHRHCIGIDRYHIISYHIISYHIISYHIISCHVTKPKTYSILVSHPGNLNNGGGYASAAYRNRPFERNPTTWVPTAPMRNGESCPQHWQKLTLAL
jgi:hypothetical protein